MSNVKAPPISEPIADQDTGLIAIPWALFFDQIFRGDTGVAWTPTFVSLTTVGSPTITGRFYQLSKSISFFNITITPATSTSATAGTTYCSNFPLRMRGNGICFAVSGLLGTNAGMCDRSSNNIYVPAWTTVTVPLTVIGIVEAS